MNEKGKNVDKLEYITSECKEWNLYVFCITETHMRKVVEICNEEYAYSVSEKGRSKQGNKGGGIVVLVRKESAITCEVVRVGECDMSEDITAVKLGYMGEK